MSSPSVSKKSSQQKKANLLASVQAAEANFSTDKVLDCGCVVCGCQAFIRIVYEDGTGVPEAPVTVIDSNGSKVEGTTDKNGVIHVKNMGCGAYELMFKEGSDEFKLTGVAENNPVLQDTTHLAALMGEYFTLFSQLHKRGYLTYDADGSSDNYVDVDGCPFTDIPDEYEAAYDRYWEIHKQVQEGPVSMRIAANKMFSGLAGETAETTMFSVAAQLAAEVIIGMIPYVGQAKDIYDISYWSYETYEGKDSEAHWLEGFLNVIGIVPGVGDGVKVIGRAISRALRHADIRMLQKAGKIIRSLSKGNITEYLKTFDKELDEVLKAVKPQMDKILAALDEAVINSKNWIIRLVKAQFAGLVAALKKLRNKLDDIAAKLKKQVKEFVEKYTHRSDGSTHKKKSQVRDEEKPLETTNPHAEQAEHDELMNQHEGNNTQCTSAVCQGKGEPVDILTGKVFEQREDFRLAGPLPLSHERYYHSAGLRQSGLLGTLWRSSWDLTLRLDGTQAIFTDLDFSEAAFTKPYPGIPMRSAAKPGWELSRDSQQNMVLQDKQGIRYTFGHAFGPLLRLTQIEDAYGNTNQFLYDRGTLKWVILSDDRLIQVETQRRRITRLTLCDAQKNPLRELAAYTYDKHGQLTAVRGAPGCSFDYQYNKDGGLTRWQDLAHTWVEHDYDDKGRAIATRCADGLWYDQIRYDDDNHIHYYKNAFGGIEAYHLDERNLPYAIVDSDGNRTEQQWQGDLLVSETNAAGETTTYSHDDNGNITEVTQPDGKLHVYQYNEHSRLTGYTAPDGARWLYEHNQQGDVTTVTDPDGRQWHYSYTESGQRASETAPDGSITRYQYHANGLLRRIDPATGYGMTLSYDVHGRLIKRESDNKQVRRWCYDHHHPHPSQVIYEDGTTARFTYDIEGNLTTITDAAGHTRTFAYGAFDRLLTVTDPLGATTQYHYNQEGEFAGVTNSQGNEWRYEFDDFGRICTERHYDGRKEHFSYTLAGQLASRTKPDGHRFDYQYDPCGRLLEAQSFDADNQPTGKSWYEYDAAGRLRYAENSDAWVEMQYSPAGLLLNENLNGTPITHEYDAAGRRIQMQGAHTPRAFEWQQQQLMQLQIGEADTRHDLLSFSWHESGLEASRRSDSGFALHQDYSATGLLTGQRLGLFGTHMLRQYQYDALDQLSEIKDSHRGYTQFSHNANGQISAVRQRRSWEPRASFVQLFGYDSELNLNETGSGSEFSGNVISMADERLKRQTKQYDNAGRVVETGRFKYVYDACGRVTTKTESKNGYRPQTTKFIWNDEDRLTHIELPDGTRYRYRYDPFGRRVAKECLKTQTQTHYLWDGNTVIQQSQITADGTALQSTEYLYEPDTFRPLAQITTDHDTGRERLHYIITDHAGTPQELCSPEGEIQWRGNQQLWGNFHQQTEILNRGYLEEAMNDAVHCDLRYQGQLEDTESGLYYNLNRYFDSDSGQYLSPDPIGFAGGLRPQGYVHNPVAWVDPLGLSPDCYKKIDRGAPELGGFAKGISADEIKEINRSLGNTAGAYRDPSTALYNASHRNGFYDKAASLIRDIAGGHMFRDANKRTTQSVIEKLMDRNGISGGPD
ncbi:RHS repeat-associated core domain-containing protein, partial [Vibrio aerogenes]